MPTLHIPPSLDLHYQVDDYTDPWRTPGTILLLHGNAESSAAWYAWVPPLAQRYRVVRPDMRGFGASTPMPREFPWTLDLLIDDFCRRFPKNVDDWQWKLSSDAAATDSRHILRRDSCHKDFRCVRSNLSRFARTTCRN